MRCEVSPEREAGNIEGRDPAVFSAAGDAGPVANGGVGGPGVDGDEVGVGIKVVFEGE